MNDKLGIAAVAALLGAGLLTTKRFNKTMRAETFMAQGKRLVALRENRINGNWWDFSSPMEHEYHNATYHAIPNYNEIIRYISNQMPDDADKIRDMALIYRHVGWDASYSHVLQGLNEVFISSMIQTSDYVYAERVMRTALQSLYDAEEKEYEADPDMTYKEFVQTPEGEKAAKNLRKAIEICSMRLGEDEYTIDKQRTTRFMPNPKYLLQEDLDKMVAQFSYYQRTNDTIGNNFYLRDLLERNAKIISPKSRIVPLNRGYDYSIVYKTRFTKDDLEMIKEHLLDNDLYKFYATIVSYNNFFKQNPEIKSVGTDKDRQKYYSVSFEDAGIPVGITADGNGGGGGIVWDTEAFSSFTEAESRDLTKSAIDTTLKIIKKAQRAMKRKEAKRGDLNQRIETEQREYLTKKLTEGFAQYDDPRHKETLIEDYITLVLDGFNDEYIRFNFNMEEYPTVIAGYGEPKITKSRLYYHNIGKVVKSHNIDVSSLPVPASLKADAKTTFEENMNYAIQQAQRELESAQAALDKVEKEKADGLNRL